MIKPEASLLIQRILELIMDHISWEIVMLQTLCSVLYMQLLLQMRHRRLHKLLRVTQVVGWSSQDTSRVCLKPLCCSNNPKGCAGLIWCKRALVLKFCEAFNMAICIKCFKYLNIDCGIFQIIYLPHVRNIATLQKSWIQIHTVWFQDPNNLLLTISSCQLSRCST